MKFNPFTWYLSGKSSGAPPLSASVISYWKMENNVTDSKGFNNGTASSLTYENGNVYRRAVFNGSSSKIDIADSSSLTFGNGTTDLPFSISMLVSFDTTSASSSLFTKYNVSFAEYALNVFGSDINFGIFTNYSNYMNIVYTISRTIGQVYHIVATYDGSKTIGGLKIYIDGVLVTSSNNIVGTYTGMNNTTCPATIAYRTVGTANYHDGTIDEVIIFNKALSPSDVSFAYYTFLSGNHL